MTCRGSENIASGKFMRVVRVVGEIAGEGGSRSLKSSILIFHHLENNFFF